MSETAVQPSAVVEALIREYLIKKGLTATVDCFNREKPKDGHSITKRDVLRKSLGLERAAARYKRNYPDSQLPTTLELFVDYQMSKVNNMEVSRSIEFVEGRQGSHVPVTASMQGALPSKMQQMSVGEGAMFQKTSQALRISQEGSPATRSSSKQPGAVGQSPSKPVTNPSPSRSSSFANGSGAAGSSSSKMRSPSPSVRPSSSKPASASGPRAPSPAQKPAGSRSAVKQPVAASEPVKLSGSHRKPSSKRMDDMVLEDMEFDTGDAPSSAPIPAARTLGRGGVSGGQQLAADAVKSLRALLWGGLNQPPPSWKQGFFYSNVPNLQFGLVQVKGGPCGVLAAMQAHVLSALRMPDGFQLRPSQQQQQGALVHAISTVLWQARSSTAAPAVVVSASLEGGGSLANLDYNMLCRVMVQNSAMSLNDLQALVQQSFSQYTEPTGWGICLFLASLLLTRTPAQVRADMDEPSNSLMANHGYCTQELVNLVLLGQAVSNVFDGVKKVDGTVLKGVSRRSKLGLLTLFEWYKYMEVGRYLKDPDVPVWVVCSESHFTVLFAMDSRAMRGNTPFDLYYYDELANQDNIIKLTVKTDPKGGWTARVGDTMGDRGKCEGQNIPPLECVIETKWPGVKVDWNGADPIL